jgi:predicted acyl esterase
VGGNGIGFIDAGEKDQAQLEAREKSVGDLLVYTSAALEEDLYVVGSPKATLWVRCLSPRAAQADFVVRLCDVDARGRSVNICDGVRRVEDLAALERDATGQFFKVEVDVYPVRAWLCVWCLWVYVDGSRAQQ